MYVSGHGCCWSLVGTGSKRCRESYCHLQVEVEKLLLFLLTSTMEVALSSRIFKRLFAHETCSVLRYSAAIQSPGTGSIRHRSTTSKAAQESIRDRTSWTHRSLLFEDAKDKEFSRYNHVTADQLRHRTTRPKKVSMLMRDFIEGQYTTSRVTNL